MVLYFTLRKKKEFTGRTIPARNLQLHMTFPPTKSPGDDVQEQVAVAVPWPVKKICVDPFSFTVTPLGIF